MTERDINFWVSVCEGNYIHLTDTETLFENIDGITVEVIEATSINSPLNHRIIRLSNEQYLIVQYAGKDFNIFLCNMIGDLCGERKAVEFLFNEDDTYADEIYDPEGTTYQQLPMGEMSYEMGNGIMATVVQYSSDSGDQIMLVEWDNIDNPNNDGGYIDGYLGKEIGLNEVERYVP